MTLPKSVQKGLFLNEKYSFFYIHVNSMIYYRYTESNSIRYRIENIKLFLNSIFSKAIKSENVCYFKATTSIHSIIYP